MIHVDRSRVPKPEVLGSWAADTERAEARAWFREGKGKRQERFDFKVYKHDEIVAALGKLFHGKCAYCEKPLTEIVPLDVSHYRPKSSVTERPEHPGYWWLASDWDNLLLACPDCDRVRMHAGERSGKGTRFPLKDESKRAFDEGMETDEHPLLLDPTRDQPELHLIFEENGRVYSDTDEGLATISVLGLNRDDLVMSRQAVASEFPRYALQVAELLALGRTRGGTDRRRSEGLLAKTVGLLVRATQDDAPYAGMARQLLRPTFESLDREGIATDAPRYVAATPVITKARHAQAKRDLRQFQAQQSSFTLETEEGRDTYKAVRRHIERVTIRNVKAIRDLELTFSGDGSGRTQWRMLLGENGTGKSTVLQSIALTLIGASAMVRLANMEAIHPRDYIRYRCKSGTVKVKVSGFVGPHELRFRPDRVEFTSPTREVTTVRFGRDGATVTGRGWEPQMLLLGYGATRLLPRKSAAQVTSTGDTYSRVDNLFDPFVPLRDADDWLSGLPPLEFDTAVLVLKDLLRLDPKAEFLLEGKRVIVFEHGERVPLRQLSDGYQSVVATAADILDVLSHVYPNLQDAAGIVLLDEIGAHLHPSWKMRIVESIRRAVPGVQFVASTHDPLCLRGLGPGEVVVMRRDERHRVFTVHDALPSPADLRIEQLLTSEFFGLNSTVDDDVERDFDRYYALLAKPTLDDDEQKELTDKTATLRDRQYLGTTLRDQLMYEAVDKIVAEHKRRPVETIPNLKKAAVDAVAKIWAETTKADKT